MCSKLTPTSFFAICAVALPGLLVVKHISDVYNKTSSISSRRLIEVDSVPDSLHTSRTVKHIVNPRGHVSVDDSRHIEIPVPPNTQCPKDEALLAAFIRGFFGGRVFAPERSLLRLTRPTLASFAAIDNASIPSPIWDIKCLEGDALPALHTVLFGGFQVGHIELDQQPSWQAGSEPTSTVDFVFGSDKAEFGGVHRFMICRDGIRPDIIEIHYVHMSCNPTVNKPLKPDFLFPLHKMYARWLFKEALVEVMRRLEGERP